MGTARPCPTGRPALGERNVGRPSKPFGHLRTRVRRVEYSLSDRLEWASSRWRRSACRAIMANGHSTGPI